MGFWRASPLRGFVMFSPYKLCEYLPVYQRIAILAVVLKNLVSGTGFRCKKALRKPDHRQKSLTKKVIEKKYVKKICGKKVSKKNFEKKSPGKKFVQKKSVRKNLPKKMSPEKSREKKSAGKKCWKKFWLENPGQKKCPPGKTTT